MRTFIAIPSIGTVDIRFAVSLASLKKPPGTAIASSPRSMPDVARNFLFDQAVKHKYESVLFLDDDMTVDAGILEQLQKILSSDEKIAAAAPLAFRRHPPFHPCAMQKLSNGTYEPVGDLEAGLVDVDATHFAATLVRTSWLEKISAPRFEFSRNQDALKGEDVVLSEKLKALGARLVVDTRLPDALHIGIPQLVGRKAYEMARQMESRLVVP